MTLTVFTHTLGKSITCTPKHSLSHTHTHAHTNSLFRHTHSGKASRAHTNILSLTHTCTHTHTHTHTDAHRQLIKTFTQTQTHTHMYKCTHAHTHMQPTLQCLNLLSLRLTCPSRKCSVASSPGGEFSYSACTETKVNSVIQHLCWYTPNITKVLVTKEVRKWGRIISLGDAEWAVQQQLESDSGNLISTN